jgi:hypothetical protein
MGRPRDEIYKRLEPGDGECPELAHDYGLQARLPNRRIQLWREPDGSVVIVTKTLLRDRRIGTTATRYTKEAAQYIEGMLTETREQQAAGRMGEAGQ